MPLNVIRSNQEYFCDGTRRDSVPEALSRKHASQNCVPEHFFPGIGISRLGGSCYPTALLSNKLAYFVQFIKNYDRILGHYAFWKIVFF
jgi:hypothetical protein